MSASDPSSLALASLFGLDGKVAVVTGGSRGIGDMIASGLVANGVRCTDGRVPRPRTSPAR